jgi:alpha,alpha-trehalose-phosphate synthase [UDP-forming]
MIPGERPLILVSNRLPVVLEREGESWKMQASAGGLVSALMPAVAGARGTWIGWSGTGEDPEVARLLAAQTEPGYRLKPVFLTPGEKSGFYCGFSIEILWPLFHDLQSRCNFEPSYWETYQQVNAKFAAAVAESSGLEDFVWVHDYHLMLVGEKLRQAGVRRRTGFFLHIPFPAPDIFEKLPWRRQVLEALLAYGLVGFQTPRDLRNFANCLRRLVPQALLHRQEDLLQVQSEGGSTWAGSFPIGIDFAAVERQAETAEAAHVAARIRADLAPCQVVLGVDRLDYTKGIPERLKAFRELLRQPNAPKVSLVQVVVPSRADLPRYQDLKLEVERLVSQINGEHGQTGWVPVHYLYRQLPPAELFSYYRAADVALITPLKDGMNLVAKEYCAARSDQDGVLVLSEYAGAAAELGCGAILVNPYDVEGAAAGLRQALTMEAGERRARMRRMRRRVRHTNAFRWFDSFLGAAERLEAAAAVAA